MSSFKAGDLVKRKGSNTFNLVIGKVYKVESVYDCGTWIRLHGIGTPYVARQFELVSRSKS